MAHIDSQEHTSKFRSEFLTVYNLILWIFSNKMNLLIISHEVTGCWLLYYCVHYCTVLNL